VLTNALSLRGAVLLPRDTRDTLFLLAVIAWVVALQAAHIPTWTTALTGAVLAWRSWLALKAQPLPGWPWRAGLLVIALAGTWLTHGTLLGQHAGVTLVVVLLALKTLELRARRDAFVVFFLGFFALLTHFFYSQTLLTAAGILIALLGLLTAVVNAHMPVGRHRWRRQRASPAAWPCWARRSCWRCSSCFHACRRCGACRTTAWAPAACRRKCASATLPNSHWTTASRCACASAAARRPRA
jgi:hypothetical protein